MKKKILITGGLGMIGQEIARQIEGMLDGCIENPDSITTRGEE